MTEDVLYQHVAQYLNLKHPRVLYRFDQGGMWTSSHKARNLYGGLNRRAWPDLFIAHPIHPDDSNASCAGLFLELKRDGTRLRKKDGTWASQHIAEQAAVLNTLKDAGYYAEFAVGIDQAIMYIECYLGGVFTNTDSEAVPF